MRLWLVQMGIFIYAGFVLTVGYYVIKYCFELMTTTLDIIFGQVFEIPKQFHSSLYDKISRMVYLLSRGVNSFEPGKAIMRLGTQKLNLIEKGRVLTSTSIK